VTEIKLLDRFVVNLIRHGLHAQRRTISFVIRSISKAGVEFIDRLLLGASMLRVSFVRLRLLGRVMHAARRVPM